MILSVSQCSRIFTFIKQFFRLQIACSVIEMKIFINRYNDVHSVNDEKCWVNNLLKDSKSCLNDLFKRSEVSERDRVSDRVRLSQWAELLCEKRVSCDDDWLSLSFTDRLLLWADNKVWIAERDVLYEDEVKDFWASAFLFAFYLQCLLIWDNMSAENQILRLC